MRTIGTLFCALLLIGGTHLAMDRAPEAVITIEAWSPGELLELGWTTHPSTGLDVVGIGELVYLYGEEASGEDVFTWSWSFVAKPAGSNPAPPSLFEQRFTFRPDMAGTYTVQLNITTPTGVSTASVNITAADYVGVGNIGGATPSFLTGQCAACHSGQAADWAETGHATMFSLGIDGVKSSHYGEGCIDCHTVGYNTEAQAVNGGFDDVADDLGWTFPATLEDGNWQDILDNYPELAQVSNIQCENCHGPGSLHKGNTDTIALSIEEGMCGRCHEDGSHHIFPTEWKNSKHANGTTFARGTSSSCAPCHSGWGAIAAFDPTSELSKTSGNQNITCAVCHDPHSAENDHQLRKTDPVVLNNGETLYFGGKGLFCMNCHRSRRDALDYVEGNVSSHFGPHYNNQADMLAGTNAINFGYRLPSSLHRDALEDTCVSCHMAAGPGEGEPGFMQLGGHTWNIVVRPGDTDLSDLGAGLPAGGLDNTAVCMDCHGEFDTFDEFPARKDHDGDGDVETAREELHGLLEELETYLPPLGEHGIDLSSANIAWYADKPWAKKILYNHGVIEEDGSGGMHNYAFSVALIQLSIDVAKFGVLTEGMITGVADVPNDQGKQVMVEWTRFGGDGPSDNPVEVYYVWRQGESAAAKAGYRSVGDVPFAMDGSLEGVTASFAGETWTMVGSQPAATLDMYAASVATLFDGTDATFMVTGHTSVSTIFAATAPETGQSVDNLVPQAPSGVASVGSETAIMLKWVAPQDPDINYYEVYKSTVENFDPTLMDPLAKLTETEYIDQDVVAGGTYFYQVTAYDFSGNRGVFSAEKMATATAIELTGEVPAQFELSQNYPNPFNPTTNIEFAIPEAGKVTITIFDVSGKQVGTLVSEFMQPGRYTLPWNAQALASGVYIYKMESGSFVKTNTMLLIK